jgi:histidyl-tRNA synthetase
MSEAFRPEARAPRGFQDRRARDVRLERRVLEAVSRVYEAYGFEPLETSALEYADALGKFLPDSDRPNEGVFALQDDDEQWVALRYDLTAPLARFAAQNWTSLPKPFRRYAFGSVWRNEKPGPGRYREFLQCDADTVGSARPEADAEMIALAVAGFAAAGLPAGASVIKVNDRRLLNGLMQRAGVEDPAQRLGVLRAVDKLDRLGVEGVRLLLGAGRKDESGAFTKGAGLSAEAIDAVLSFVGAGADSRTGTLDRLEAVVGSTPEGREALETMAAIHAALNGLGVDEAQARFDPSVVRGLEYYTGPVFEAELLLETTDDRGEPVRFGSIGGGGRYDDLVARFTGERTPATGFSFGVSRLAAALQAAGAGAEAGRGPVVVIAFDPSRMADYFAVAAELRNAGVAAEVYLGSAGMKAQMKYADRRGSPAAVILGEDEIRDGTVTVKDLDLGRKLAQGLSDNAAWREGRPGQVTVPRAEMVAAVRATMG